MSRHEVSTLVPAFALAFALVSAWARPSDAAPGDSPGVAVVELFSSEGCSSCPPAERYLADLAEEARRSGRRILPLEFHVDYWNHLGWADPFSSAAFSRRQEDYVRALDLAQMYTPQMIVNGTEEFVGSDRGRGARAVELALSHAPRVQVRAWAKRAGKGWLVGYHLSGSTDGAQVCVALVESGLVSRVRRGENSGRTLEHTGVVRRFESVAIGVGGQGTLTLEPHVDIRAGRGRAVVFVQDPRTSAILGAAAVDL